MTSRDDDMYTVEANDPSGDLAQRYGLEPEQAQRIGRIMKAMARLRDVEKQVLHASQRFMQLKQTDMRALHYLITRENLNIPATPSMLAAHLGITTASTTKLLDRLERRGHIARHPHPNDRRAICVTVTPGTRTAATTSMGKHQLARLKAAAQLTPDQCEIVVQFLANTADDIESSLRGDEL